MQTSMTTMGWNLAAVASMMVMGWVVSLVFRNVTIVDSLWGLGFVVIAWLTYFMSDGFWGRKLLIAILVTLWGLRLSAYLSWRNWGKGEDPRYGGWREKSGDRFWLVSLFKVFILQAVFLWVIALALQIGQLARTPATLTLLDITGIIFWTIGFIFESVGDWQLAHFKSDPTNKGLVMDRGLWAFTRHPNYFGEFLIWWGVFLITLSTPNSWWTIFSPLIMTAVLLKMTGIPLTEKGLVENRPGYSDYIKRTSAFFPWRPAKEAK
jgi:steroid 5-alpha reductase family enzyme